MQYNIKNQKIFKDFFYNHYQSVYAFVKKYIDDSDHIHDITQESFIKLWNSDVVFETESEVKSYLYTIARNNALNSIKHGDIKEQYKEYVLREHDEGDFRNYIIEQETYNLIYQSIDSLPRQSRRIMMLVVDGFGNHEIAQQLSISVNSVRTLKRNAINKLKEQFKEYQIILSFLNIHSQSADELCALKL